MPGTGALIPGSASGCWGGFFRRDEPVQVRALPKLGGSKNLRIAPESRAQPPVTATFGFAPTIPQ
jgi:hypothetical protein